MAKLYEMTIPAFIDKLSSSEAVPGGGSVAALVGSLSGALVQMVGLVTQGKKGYEEAQETAQILIEQGCSLKQELLEAVDQDAAAFQQVMDAFKLPKETDEQKKERSQAIQAGYKVAAEVPLQVARGCLSTAELALVALERGNENAASDAGVGVLTALTGLEGALMNVYINLSAIKDEEWVKEVKEECEGMLLEARQIRTALWNCIRTKIQGLPNE